MTQRAIAEQMEEDEGALSSKLAGKRGITDEYIDKFAETYKIPFTVGNTPERDALVERIVNAQAEQTMLITSLTKMVHLLIDQQKKG